MRKSALFVAVSAVLIFLSSSGIATATVVALVDLSSQTMVVTHRGDVIGRWPVSTARKGKITPTGSWTAKWLSRYHRSSRYENAPMPYSVFYSGHYAVHGTYETKRLGSPASSGCIRLHPRHAAIFFRLAQREGLRNTRIVVRW
jgi:lipoprotein-anchoring transpeptidase ErfK/SrfK